MLIRAEQLDALRAVALQAFRNLIADHLRRHFPKQTAELGPQLQEFVSHAIERARLHGFTAQQPVCRYAGVMCVLGRDFDEELDWARQLLAGSSDPAIRIEILVAEAIDRLRQP
jgi:hypothetical protein